MASIFVAKLDFSVTEEELRKLFEQYGRVSKATIALDKETRKPRGFAFVEMPDSNEATNAIKNLDGISVNGRQIAVKEADQRGSDNRSSDNRERFDNRDRGDRKPNFSRDRDSAPRNTNIQSDYKKPIDDRPKNAITVSSPDEIRIDPKKKEKAPKAKDWDADGKNKKPKMNAYKKSGKNNRFFDEDEDEDWDIPYKNNYDEEEDEDDFYDDEEE